ncbi:hypothetical protein MPRM_33650 [Mycobacterium parmense]|uniref:Serine/threonine protein kinase n=1 Tax=Mycobacterium parmense TaxID=185642 RepID=A0A7I7YYK6_9MYCO|nr:serine/threonine protein kinase [Mycobacterium parmense]BBZ46084.1 hypothetical protein MPRM_33650 [Mycobacterium parmense]
MRALRAVLTAALIGGSAAGIATAGADPGTGNPADVNTLATSLSKGYSLDNCTPESVTAGELAALTCGRSPDPAGPVLAKYVLLRNGGEMAGMFIRSIAEDLLTDCGTLKSPNVWHRGGSTEPTGQVACGTFQNQAEVIWTIDDKKVLSLIRGSTNDVPSLYQWWQANG